MAFESTGTFWVVDDVLDLALEFLVVLPAVDAFTVGMDCFSWVSLSGGNWELSNTNWDWNFCFYRLELLQIFAWHHLVMPELLWSAFLALFSMASMVTILSCHWEVVPSERSLNCGFWGRWWENSRPRIWSSHWWAVMSWLLVDMTKICWLSGCVWYQYTNALIWVLFGLLGVCSYLFHCQHRLRISDVMLEMGIVSSMVKFLLLLSTILW